MNGINVVAVKSQGISGLRVSGPSQADLVVDLDHLSNPEILVSEPRKDDVPLLVD